MKIGKRAKQESRQLMRWCVVNDALDEDRVRLVARRVAAAGARNRLAILSHFRRLVKLELGQRTVIIESATPLPPHLQAVIESGLRRRYGPHLATVVTHQPALIGGIRIQVGCDVYDGSVRGRLRALENSF